MKSKALESQYSVCMINFIALKNSLVKRLDSHFFNYFGQKVRPYGQTEATLFAILKRLIAAAYKAKINFIFQINKVSLFSKNGYFCETVASKNFHLDLNSSIKEFQK